MSNKNYSNIHPKQIADKSIKQNLYDAIQMALQVESDSVKRNTAVFNTNRYIATGKLNDYEELKEKARAIKEKSIEDLPKLIEQTKSSIESRGGKVFIAKNSKEANDYIKLVCESKKAKLVVKAKSITSEEIKLNEVLEDIGIEIAETDLAEFILQISKEQPSHNVAPAIHQSRERISKLFKDHFRTNIPLETGEDLTKFARDILREKFLNADIGISGANLITADTGSILLVESEGNIRLSTHVPATHIAIAGVEKIIQNFNDISVFIELLAASGTGQSLTSYTNIITPPIKAPIINFNGRNDDEREFHLVLIDNGRMQMRSDEVFREALYCIRCSACMNVCANFQSVGGHAFGGECYTGGIGGSWAYGTTGNIKSARFAELCTGCSRCVPNCPVQINIPRLNTEIKNRIIKQEGSSFQKQFYGNFSQLAKVASKLPNVSNYISNLPFTRSIMEKTVGFDKDRPLPKFSSKTLVQLYENYSKKNKQHYDSNIKIILFPDVFTNYNNAEIGLSVVKVFNKLGFNVEIGESLDDGRALLSQGLVDQTKVRAERVARYLTKLIDQNFNIIISEPSVLSMFRYEYETLLNSKEDYSKIKSKCFDPFEFLNLHSNEISFTNFQAKNKNEKIIYHGHCQLKSIGLAKEVPKLFEKFGIKINETTAECCGMAGSFGYKKEYYELSKKVGKYLGKEIEDVNPQIITASGTSCREQISDELRREVIHPIELLEKTLN
jgi:iron-sulfur cluster protein